MEMATGFEERSLRTVVASSRKWRWRVAAIIAMQALIALVIYVQDTISTIDRGDAFEWDDYLVLTAFVLLLPTAAVVIASERRYRRLIDDAMKVDSQREQAYAELMKADAEKQRLLAHLVHAKEDERRRVAADIHDDSIQLMTSVVIGLEREAKHATDGERREALDRLEATARRAVERLRTLVFELRPPALDDHGLGAALRLHLEEFSLDTGIAYDLRNQLETEPGLVERETLFRIAQEALTNVRKHANASRVEVTLRPEREGICLIVQDDGIGLDQTAPSPVVGHIGLTEMRERAEMSGGRFQVRAGAAGGTRVDVWVPSTTVQAPG